MGLLIQNMSILRSFFQAAKKEQKVAKKLQRAVS